MKKRVSSVIAIGLVLMTYFTRLPIEVKANEECNDEKMVIIDMNNAFSDNNGEYNYIEKKIDEETESYTGLLDKEIEDILNRNGIFDEDIEKCSKEELEELENNVNEDTIICASYYALNDSEELEDVPVEENDLIELTDEQVDMYMAEKYYNIETDLEETISKDFEEESEDKLSPLGKIAGFNATDVCAETITHGGVSDKQHYAKLKETLVINELKDGKYMYVWFKFEWTEMPKNRLVDTIGLGWDGAEYDAGDAYSGKTSVLHSWYENYISYGYNASVKTYYKEKYLQKKYGISNLGVETYGMREGCLGCVISMHADQPYSVSPSMIDLEYSNESVAMTFYLQKKPNKKCVTFFPYYIHVKQKYGYNLSNIVSAAVAFAEGSSLSSIYTLASGTTVSFISGYSGPKDVKFVHLYK